MYNQKPTILLILSLLFTDKYFVERIILNGIIAFGTKKISIEL